jgi:hypothetical protein
MNMETEFGQNDIEVITNILSTLKKFDSEEREKILQTIDTYFDRNPRSTNGTSKFQEQPESNYSSDSAFSEDRSMSPKTFLTQKKPQTDVERIACLAYYLTHYMNMPHFKTIDLSKLNTEAAQPKFSNAAMAVDNATKAGYLVPATKGNKQLSVAGEHFVQALPDREAARAAMKAVKPRRKVKKQNNKKVDHPSIAA